MTLKGGVEMKIMNFARMAGVICVFLTHTAAGALTEDIRFTFDDRIGGWDVPDWAFEKKDYVAGEVLLTGETVKTGSGALEVVCDFPGNRWAAALVELERDMDLSEYNSISADIFIPQGAPQGFFKARFIITAGIGWYFIEMREPVDLLPGQWVNLTAKIEKQEELVSAWKGRGESRLFSNIHLVKKLAIRIEYNASPPQTIGASYHGPIYIDNVVISK